MSLSARVVIWANMNTDPKGFFFIFVPVPHSHLTIPRASKANKHEPLQNKLDTCLNSEALTTGTYCLPVFPTGFFQQQYCVPMHKFKMPSKERKKKRLQLLHDHYHSFCFRLEIINRLIVYACRFSQMRPLKSN